ncbi:hypothetical protein NDU88_003657 [Pleurodeles waltl]|uniref:CCHC-type domain-containing protein n=1 Tax=Pleurodeles waltl TaxID=8319 RepID=A0AAV7TPL8_PLEWA|nr:hypothetical protein NDU88_003657 [Pleurodeles waltl]
MTTYVSSLKKLAITCRFGALHDELMRDQIVMRASNEHIQEQLWAKEERPLHEVIDIVKRAELTGKCAKAVLKDGNDKNMEQKVAKVSGSKYPTHVLTKKKYGDQTAPEERSKQFNTTRKKCYRCVSANHLVNDKRCPARNLKCGKCGVIGHFQKVCQKKSEGKIQLVHQEEDGNTSSSDDTDLNMCVLSENDECILYGDTSINMKKKKTICDVCIGGIVADSG